MNIDFSKNMVLSKPITPSKRNRRSVNKTNLQKNPLLKNQITGKIKKSTGRNNQGKIVAKHKGGGNKNRYRFIKLNRNYNSTGIVMSIEFDPNRSANIASIFETTQNTFYYILAPKKLKIGDIVESGANIEPKLGNSIPVHKIRVGSFIHNVSTNKKKTAKIARAAGTFCKMKEVTFDSVKVKLPSGEERFISKDSYATIGIVSNEFFFLTRLSKAGQSRWLNKRPTVRGVAMNPVDHPHGGGEGKKSGKGKTPWGRMIKNGKTSRSKNRLIIKHRN